ncbi:helix-turn-helix domain-containing protein [Sinanaerobacter chloroacetimidivorans]|uniref:Helix-turn-helix domain-containing protein n=1 Tax=Sinanaerobacter chloroacetimidivorans TaxID=2818044 RepID=A0A8J8B379_9FIRM|nr:helix-turn-helix domain-containing protein [Sinanaerobacter chloroacetimidivorans]MBR0600084.1 helix-turn-helix domain-containing protein [Sinanaerobacter chloroacetimidivorans]
MVNRIILEDEMAIEILKNEFKSISHWHEETVEIVVALRGIIKVQIVGDEYLIKEEEMIFVNKWMVHKIERITEDAILIVLHLDLKFFERYVENSTRVFFVRNPNLHPEEKLTLLRSLIARILVIDQKKGEMHEKNIIEIGQKLLEMMIKDFNYIEKNPELYRSPENFDRVWTALRYMLDNHSAKVSLSSIASFVHLSDSYLSHSIKKETGKGYEYWLNLFRAENAARLLVSTNTSIAKISDDCGFSDPKFLVKHFKNYFKHLPSEYREINRRELSSQKKEIKESDKLDEINYIIDAKINAYILGKKKINSYSTVKKQLQLDIDCSITGKPLSRLWAEYLNVGAFTNLHKSSFQQWLMTVQKMIGFNYALIDFPFDGDEVQCAGGQIHFNMQDIIEIHDYLQALNLKPCIRFNTKKYSAGEMERITEAFLNNAVDIYGTLEDWRCIVPKRLTGQKALISTLMEFKMKIEYEEEAEIKNNYLFDTAYIAPLFIDGALKNRFIGNRHRFNKLFDDSENNFMGDTGLVSNGLKKPLYWAHYLLSLLGEEILYQGDGFIATKNRDNYQILLWNHSHSLDSISLEELNLNIHNRYVIFENEKPIEVKINIIGLSNNHYIIKKLLFDRNYGSVYDRLEDVRIARYLTKKEKDILNETCNIKTSYGISNGKTELSLLDEIPINGAVMFIISEWKKN